MEECASDAAASRLRYLSSLKSMIGKGPVHLHLHDTEEPREASEILAIKPDPLAFLVKDLQTPLGCLKSAIIRGEDVRRVDVTLNTSKQS